MNAFFYIKDNEVSAMTIGDRIFDRLKEIGMTQKEFSEKTGISQSTISMRHPECDAGVDPVGIIEDRKPGK